MLRSLLVPEAHLLVLFGGPQGSQKMPLVILSEAFVEGEPGGVSVMVLVGLSDHCQSGEWPEQPLS